MAKYIVVSTWNGEGYSYKNKAYLREFKSDDEAQKYIQNLLRKSGDNKLTEKKGRIEFGDEEDEEGEEIQETGSYGWYRLKPNSYGVAIQCNINECVVLDKKGYDKLLKEVVKDADPEEVEDVDLASKNVFLGAYNGEYDYQFIRF